MIRTKKIDKNRKNKDKIQTNLGPKFAQKSWILAPFKFSQITASPEVFFAERRLKHASSLKSSCLVVDLCRGIITVPFLQYLCLYAMLTDSVRSVGSSLNVSTHLIAACCRKLLTSSFHFNYAHDLHRIWASAGAPSCTGSLWDPTASRKKKNALRNLTFSLLSFLYSFLFFWRMCIR